MLSVQFKKGNQAGVLEGGDDENLCFYSQGNLDSPELLYLSVLLKILKKRKKRSGIIRCRSSQLEKGINDP